MKITFLYHATPELFREDKLRQNSIQNPRSQLENGGLLRKEEATTEESMRLLKDNARDKIITLTAVHTLL